MALVELPPDVAAIEIKYAEWDGEGADFRISYVEWLGEPDLPIGTVACGPSNFANDRECLDHIPDHVLIALACRLAPGLVAPVKQGRAR